MLDSANLQEDHSITKSSEVCLSMSKQALASTKALYEAIQSIQKNGGSELDLDAVKRVVKQANSTIHRLDRELAQLKVQARVEKDVLRAEMHSELIDVAANAARVAERQSVLFERAQALNGSASACDRAGASASFVESALHSLCPHNYSRSPGCDQLAALASRV